MRQSVAVSPPNRRSDARRLRKALKCEWRQAYNGSGMKKIIFKFSGGPLDGTTVSGFRAKDPEVRRYYVLTHHGRVGQRFRTASDYAVNQLVEILDEPIEVLDEPADEVLDEPAPHHFQQHVYEVVDRIVNREVVLIMIDYVPGAKV